MFSYFFADELVTCHLTELEREIIALYYSFNKHNNLDNRLYDIVISTHSDKLVKLNYFKCDVLIPIIFKLEKIGYTIEWDLNTCSWAFIVNCKM